MPWKPDYLELEEAKAFLRLTDTVDDIELAIIITAASRAVDDHCNRQFGHSEGAQTRVYTAWYDDERDYWVTPVDDFMTAAGLVVTVGGVVTTDFVKEPVNASQDGMPWTAIAINGTAAVVPTGEEHEVLVTANPFGWTAFPSQVVMGTKLQISRFLSRRDSPYGIAGSGDAQMRLLSRLDPDVAVSLRGLVRPRKVG